MRFAFIDKRIKQFPVQVMCDILDVSRSGYYAWRDRPICARQQRRAELVEKIKAVFEESRGTYGSPRETVELKEAVIEVSENTVAKYMRESGICVTPRRRFVPQTTDSDHPYPIAPNLLDQDFTAAAPDQKWACDLTYIWTDEGWLYLSVVIDLFSRRIIGWSMTDHLRAEGVAMLSGALARQQSVDRVSFIDAMRYLAMRLLGLIGVANLRLNPHRPGRRQPRVIRRRMKEYDLLREPRNARIAREIREETLK